MAREASIIRFTKMHGIGNDYLYINVFEDGVPAGLDDVKKWPALVRAMSDRHFGVGSDGVILVMPPAVPDAGNGGEGAHVQMRMFNADGSESEMCGNGIRCVCKLAHDRGISKANPMRVQTGRGVLSLAYTTNGDGTVDQVTVDMGEPILEAARIPIRGEGLKGGQAFALRSIFTAEAQRTQRGKTLDEVFSEAGMPIAGAKVTCVSMGNPHAVIECANVKNVELERIGPVIERAPAFPARINVHIVQVHSAREVTMRTWERGTGITLACGTGASAVCVAGVLAGRTDREILSHLPGGDLWLRWDEKSNHVFKTGPATEICAGEWRG